ncbi:MFS transporter [Nocardia noduli]|uniref:MFS transporter n=1 Tax=Nocardia noduli TaxID=2815722 RepID=UPI001C21EB9A|nr:MFS transporter [Nocardia noduli]
MSNLPDPVLRKQQSEPQVSEPQVDEKPSRTAWLIALVTIGASLMDLLDATAISVASPSIRSSFEASTSALQWMIAAYTLTFSVMLIAGGRLGDVFGRRNVFLIGLVGFVAASVACSLAQSADVLIFTRAIQGAFAAVMIPQGFGLVRAAFPPGKAAMVFGVMGPIMGIGGIAGPILGGLLVGDLGWRAIFWINIPIGIVVLIGALRLLPHDERQAGERPRLDVIGLLLASAAVFLFAYPIVQGREADWAAWTWIMMACSVVVLALFGVHQLMRRRAGRDPFIEPSLFRKRAFNAGLLVQLLFNGGFLGMSVIGTLLLQIGLNFSPLHAGSTLLWWMLGTLLSMGLAQKFAQIYPRRVLQIGLMMLALSMAVAAVTIRHYGADLTSLTIGPALLIGGFGMGMCYAPIFGVILAAVDDREVGSASGLVNSFQQLGGGIGVAVFGTLFFGWATDHGVFEAAQYTYWIAAAALLFTWAVAFLVPKTARSAEELAAAE